MSDIETPATEDGPDFVDAMFAFLGAGLPCELVVKDDNFVIRNWRNEAELRKQLARLAFLFGWDVSEEVVVPGWGRIDIVLTDRDQPQRPILIELKLKLNRPSDARKAFQQIDGYGRWWKATKNQNAELVLVAVEHEEDAVASVREAYPEVSLYAAGHLMTLFQHWRNPATRRWRLARSRLDDARRVLELHEHAMSVIDGIRSQP